METDWGAPVSKPADDEFKLEWDDDEAEKSDDSDGGLHMQSSKKPEVEQLSGLQSESNNIERTETLDIMAQQLKFVACLKILMEELSTLATGFEVDGGQLRYQLYVWLEKEVEALKQLCNYSANENETAADEEGYTNEQVCNYIHKSYLTRPQCCSY